MRRLVLPTLTLAALGLSGCMAVSAVGTAVDVVGTAVSTTADIGAAAVGAVTPDSDCKNGKDSDGDEC